MRNTFGRKGSEGTTGPVVCVSACACVHECVGGRGKHTDTGHEGEGECVSGCREGRSREEACPPALSLVRPCPNAVIISEKVVGWTLFVEFFFRIDRSFL